MKAHRWVRGMILAAAVAWQGPSNATVVRAVPLTKLVEISDWVVIATVTQMTSQYVTLGGQTRMVTDATLRIDRSLTDLRDKSSELGDKPGLVKVRTLGGTVGDIAQAVLGEAMLTPGTQNLLFLRRGRDGYLHVAAMAQGEYIVTTDAQGQQILRPSRGLDVVTNREQSAVTELAGRTVAQAEALVTRAASTLRKLP